MPTTRFFASQSFSNLGTAIPQMVRFLMNDHASITGPAWTLVEAQSGANREVPSDPSNLDSLVSATGWPNSTISVNDWVVLESVGGNVTAHFQFYIEYQSTTAMRIIMFPLADFTTGGGAASPPTFPSTAVGNAGSTVDIGGFTVLATYSVVADEGMAEFLFDDGASPDWGYVGEFDTLYNSGSVVKDPRPFVIWDTPTVLGVGNSGWNRLSPNDDSTILSLGTPVGLMASSQQYLDGNTDFLNATLPSGSGYTTVAPWGAFFEDNGHEHFAGWARNLYSCSEALPVTSGTLSGTNFDEHGVLYRNHNSTRPGIAFTWDGVTSYGALLSGTIVESPDMAVGRASGDMGIFQVPRTSTSTSTAAATATATNVDKNRLKRTYPFKRIKKNPGTLT